MMNEFLRSINVSLFKKWLMMQDLSGLHIGVDPLDKDILIVENPYGSGSIGFYSDDIIELSVTNKKTADIDFYLHFQMNTLKHAIDLFDEMIECLRSLANRSTEKILLCCTGGLTSSLFASKIDEAINVLNMKYEVIAVGYAKIFDVANDFDIILLAPQIAYIEAKLKSIYKNKNIICIPPRIFAQYDVGALLTLIEREKMTPSTHKRSTVSLSLKQSISVKQTVLVISFIRNSDRIHMIYGLYYDGKQQIRNEIIKYRISIEDIYDLIDTVLARHPETKMVGISVPGIINEHEIRGMSINGIRDINIQPLLKQKYGIDILVSNDVNTAAVGYYATQDKYYSLAALFQPVSTFAGVGIIINGELLMGKANVAGEVQYLPLNLSQPYMELNKTPEGCIELVSKIILSIVSIIAPEAVVVFCTLITDENEITNELIKYLPQEYIPKIIIRERLDEYTIIGQYILCAQWLENKNKV